ncbi:hypothetical protein E8E12_000014, partial [Didymella heteroderae]
MLPSFYAHDPQLRFDRSLLFVVVIVPFVLGHVFIALVYVTNRDTGRHNDCTIIQVMLAIIFGLIDLAYNLLSSRIYRWGPVPIAGVLVGVCSLLACGALIL